MSQFTTLTLFGTPGSPYTFIKTEFYEDAVYSVACVSKFRSLKQARDFCFVSVSKIKGIDRISKNVKVCQTEEVN